MKNLVCCLAFCFATNIGFSQFQHSFGTERSEMGRSLTQLQNTERGYLVAGYTNQQFFGGLDATLVKTDLNGNQIWSRAYGGQSYEFFNSVRQHTSFGPINQTSYVVAGITNSFGFGAGDAWLTGTNSNGAPVFSAVYGGERRDMANCLQLTKDETGKRGYIFVGETRSYPFFPGNNMYVVRTDLNGNLTRATVIGGEGNQRGLWIENTKDGGYIIVGSTTNYYCGGSPQLPNPATDIFVVKLRADLTMQWNRILGYPTTLDPSIRHNNVATCVKENRAGNYVITGYTNSFGIDNSQDAFLLYISSTGNFLGMKTYGTKCTERGHSLQITTNSLTGAELYTVVGQRATNTRKALMFQTDAGGNLLWARDHGDVKSEGATELVRDDFNKGFAFTGYTNSLGAGGIDIYLVETNAIGESKTVCEKKIELKEKKHEPCLTRSAQQVFVDDYRRIELPVKRIEYKEDRCVTTKTTNIDNEPIQDKGVRLFPNPASNQLTIDFGNEITPNKVVIYTLEGRTVFQEDQPAKGSTTISTEMLAPGTYIVKIHTITGENQLTKFIKK